MERRVLLAISLSFAVLFLYQTFLIPPVPPSQTALNRTAPEPATALATPGNIAAASPAAPQAPVTAPVVGDTEEREITVETRHVRAVFTNRGGRIRHWILKGYKDESGEPVNLVPDAIPAGVPLPFSLRVEDPATTARLNDALYRVSGIGGTVVDATRQPLTITFDVELSDGLRAQKRFTLEPDSFVLAFGANVQQNGQPLNPMIESGPGLGDDIARAKAGSFLSPNYMYLPQAILYVDGDVERIAATSMSTGLARDGQFKWAGVDDHYYINAVLDPPAPTHFEFVPMTLASGGVPADTGTYVSYGVRFPAAPENQRFFFGPKQLDALKAVNPEFTKAIYFGMFALLAVPLLDALKWLYGFIGNWGWSIVALTVLINLAMFPLRHKSVVSMRRMQELQPQLKAIQDRYAKYKITDPERQKMNQEVMELYRSRGVNPASGCVPMLLTLPFLFAFYAMLGQAIEIRGADFLGYIKDLSRADPWFITPILMGLTMFWQQKITPSTADPTQQKIMMMMPVMISVTMLFAPAGLVIYWLVSNVWGIGQQYLTNYMIGPPKVHNVRPPGERRVKKELKETS